MIPYARQLITKKDREAVAKALTSDWLTQGPTVKAFEEKLCAYTKVRYAIAVSNGTAALHLAMLALGLGPKDEVITSPISFMASANCALYVGATPRFVDIDPVTCHLDPQRLKDFLKTPSQRKKVKAVIPVHHMGTIADIAQIRTICQKYGIKVVEDAAHAVGGGYKEKGTWQKVGSCRHSDITIFSFHPIKNMTTGEGGAILTNDKKIFERAARLRHHGIVRPTGKPAWFYDMTEPGFNYRITDFQCALGLSQIKRLDSMIRARRQHVAIYNKHFASLSEVRTPFERKDTYAAYHLYVVRVPAALRDSLYEYLRSVGILTQVNYIPIPLFSFYQKRFGYRRGDFPQAEEYFDTCLSLPLYAGLSARDQNLVIHKVKRFFNKADDK